MAALVEVELADAAPEETFADLLCVGLFDGDDLPAYLTDAPGAEDAESKLKSLAVVRPERPGASSSSASASARTSTPSAPGWRRRSASARPRRSTRPRRLGLPGEGERRRRPALVRDDPRLLPLRPLQGQAGDEDERRGRPDARSSASRCSARGDAAAAVETARVVPRAANRARDLQNLPSNVATPSYLAERAREIAVQHDSLSSR